MRRSLVELLAVWARVFSQRHDVIIEHPLQIMTAGNLGDDQSREADEPVESRAPEYPPDAAAFAEHGLTFRFQYAFKDRAGLRSMLALDLTGEAAQADLELDEHAARLASLAGGNASLHEPRLFEFDSDVTGTGPSAYFLFLEGGRPIILWDVEKLVLFASLTDYLTAGARHGFARGKVAWPAHRHDRGEWQDTAAELRQVSLPSNTPIAALRVALCAQGASGEEADELLEWLGSDASLLVALPMADLRRSLPGWFAGTPPAAEAAPTGQ
jgi:hypothetical protein